MTPWRIILSLTLFTLAGCAGYTSIEKKLEPSLACKGFILYFPEEGSWRPYQRKVPVDPDDWDEAIAVLTYDETIAHQTYIYRLTYRAKDALLNQVSPCDDIQDDGLNNQDNSDNDDDSNDVAKDEEDTERDSDNTDDDSSPQTVDPMLVQITHFLKTTLRFPRFQHVRIRYFRYAPLLFEWTAPIRVCPFL